MSGPKKPLPHGKQDDWVRTGGAIGDKSMAELDDYQRGGAGVDESHVRVCKNGDPNEDLPVKRQPGSED